MQESRGQFWRNEIDKTISDKRLETDARTVIFWMFTKVTLQE